MERKLEGKSGEDFGKFQPLPSYSITYFRVYNKQTNRPSSGFSGHFERYKFIGNSILDRIDGQALTCFTLTCFDTKQQF